MFDDKLDNAPFLSGLKLGNVILRVLPGRVIRADQEGKGEKEKVIQLQSESWSRKRDGCISASPSQSSVEFSRGQRPL